MLGVLGTPVQVAHGQTLVDAETGSPAPQPEPCQPCMDQGNGQPALSPLPSGVKPLAAQNDRWALCPLRELSLHPLRPVDDPEAHLFADEVESSFEGVSYFNGHVSVERSGTYMEADSAIYDRTADTLHVQDNVYLQTRDSLLWGDSADINLGTSSGVVTNTRFEFPGLHGFGEAKRFDFSDPEHSHLEQVSYTTCPPGNEDWLLRSDTLDLDRSTNTGEARDVTLRFKHVPFFYFPYINFPLEGRKTGLLPPTIGTSDINGTDVRVPYYLNLAPNYDATLTPRYIQNRGAMLMSEFRYLGSQERGSLNFDYLDRDKLDNNEARYAGSLSHNQHFAEGWNGNIQFNGVSDTRYFDDLGTSQALTSQTHLLRQARITYQSTYLDFLGRVQGYQTLSGRDPYQRLPQLKLSAASLERNNHLQASLDTELVNFDKDGTTDPKGLRLDLYPSFSLPLAGSAWFITPRLGYRYTQYELEQNTDNQITRALPVYSLDSGLFFERELSLADTPLLQTLEPRLYYLRVPYVDQTDIPRFDTDLYDLTFAQLFSTNRFNGADRQGDADQLTVALTSRLLDQRSGEELLRGSIGQILYFEDRKVGLDNTTPVADQPTSDIVGEIGAQLTRSLDLSSTARWNPETERNDVLTGRIRYHADNGPILSAGYRYRREVNLRQSEVAAYWPMTRQWRFLGRWQYDLERDRSLDIVSGLEYETCCWAVQFAARGTLDTTTQELNHSFYMTLELKGLSVIGRTLDDQVEHVILGE